MKKENFFGNGITFVFIIILLAAIFSLNVLADSVCLDSEEYCSGLANGGQTTVYTRGEYCYYKVEVGGEDNLVCQKRFDSSKKCWTTVGKRCNANERCTATGCKDAVSLTPPDLSASKSADGSAAQIGGGLGQETSEHGKITFACPSGGKITELQAYYYCPNDPRSRSTYCPLKQVGDDSGLTAGGIGYESASFRFDNGVCGDPCSGIVKRGKLIAKCSQSSQPVSQSSQGPETCYDRNIGEKCVDLCNAKGQTCVYSNKWSDQPCSKNNPKSAGPLGAVGGSEFNAPCNLAPANSVGKCAYWCATTRPATKISKERETETLPERPSEKKPEPISVQKIPAISAPKIVTSAECTNDKRFDFNNNLKVDYDDFFLFSDNFNKQVSDSVTGKFDLDNDKVVDYDDFFMFAEQFGKDICKEVLGDKIKTSLSGCNDRCDDADGCSCSSICVYGGAEQGQTCGDKKRESKTAFEKITEPIKNTFVEPYHCKDGIKDKDEEYVDCGGKDCKKCLDIKDKSKICKSLGYGDKCEVEFKVKVNAGKGSGVNLPIVFEYKGKIIRRDSTLAVSGARSGSEVPAITGSTTFEIEDVTGNVVQNAPTTTSTSRFNCVLKNRPEICCPLGFRVSSQDPQQCVRDEIVVVQEKSLYDRFLELAQKYLNAKVEEKENIKKELRSLE